ncbi:hypothetical protein D3C80_2062640 [compost metagenome]
MYLIASLAKTSKQIRHIELLICEHGVKNAKCDSTAQLTLQFRDIVFKIIYLTN